MDRIQAQFFDVYGYRGDADELREFALDQGYSGYDAYNDYDASYRYRPSNASRRPSYDASDANVESDVGYEFSALFRDILGESKKHKKAKEEGQQLMDEFAYMTLLFLLKTSLYFVLRYCSERGFCTDL